MGFMVPWKEQSTLQPWTKCTFLLDYTIGEARDHQNVYKDATQISH